MVGRSVTTKRDQHQTSSCMYDCESSRRDDTNVKIFIRWRQRHRVRIRPGSYGFVRCIAWYRIVQHIRFVSYITRFRIVHNMVSYLETNGFVSYNPRLRIVHYMVSYRTIHDFILYQHTVSYRTTHGFVSYNARFRVTQHTVMYRT